MEVMNSKIISGLVTIFVVVLLGFFVFFRNKEVLPDNEMRGNLPQAQNIEQNNENTPSSVGFKELFLPVVRPLEPAVSYVEDVFFENRNEDTEDRKEVSSAPETAYLTSEANLVLSEDQIFDILWPESYRDALIMLQDLMVKDGFMPESQKISQMKSDQHIYAALIKIADYAVKQGWVESVDFDKLRAGIEELERTIFVERANLRTTGKVSSDILLPGGQRIDKTPASKQSFFSMIIDGLKYSLTANTANAQFLGWHTLGADCYKDLAPRYPVPGPNLWAFCCNCGFFCTPLGCTFLPDCGPFSVACDVPLGCLNLMCKAWPNAIWDDFSYPGTGICGCG